MMNTQNHASTAQEEQPPQNNTQPPADSGETVETKQSPSRSARRINTHIFVGSLTLLLLIGVVAYIISNNTAIGSFFGKINDILMPLFIGLIAAYLANPILRFFEYVVFRRLIKKHPKLCRGLSLLLTAVTIIAIFFLVLLLIIPELINSIKDFLGNWGVYVDESVVYINDKINAIMTRFNENTTAKEYLNAREIKQYIGNIMSNSENFFEGVAGKMLGVSSMGDLVGKGFSILSAVVGAIANFFMGVIIGFYLLASKEKRYAQIMKLRNAFFSEKTNRRITEVCTMVNKSFGGYIRASLLDSVLVAVETYIIFQIFGISDYNILLAAFIGVTNIIPILGPFIGAVPTGFIVLITNPSKIWLFIILIIVIQQIDGNIICPHIVGNNTGVSPFCVVTAITIMGGLFGVVGMVVAVPTFAVIITLVKDAAERRLCAKGYSTDLGDYYDKNTLVSAEEDLRHKKALLAKARDKIWNVLSLPFRKLKKTNFNDTTIKEEESKEEKKN